MTDVHPPLAMLAELTHQCPLRCPYCSNPTQLLSRKAELATPEWLRVLEQAAALGVLQVHFSGGEPLLRPDLVELVQQARSVGLYTNLITSGVGLTEQRAARLYDAGLDSVQLSIQAATPELSDRIGGVSAYAIKLEAARVIQATGFPLSMNVVLHRLNLQEVEQIILLAETLGAERLELANTQYYGWALVNREALLPDRELLAAAEAAVRAQRARLAQKMEIIWVIPDYYSPYPKPCMDGWGSHQLTVTPDGTVLPCPAANVIDVLQFENIRDHSLSHIWYESEALNRYRGTAWMPEPCRSCERREIDLGGCRCQAFLLTGDPGATDPVCQHSPAHDQIAAPLATAAAGSPAAAIQYRK